MSLPVRKFDLLQATLDTDSQSMDYLSQKQLLWGIAGKNLAAFCLNRERYPHPGFITAQSDIHVCDDLSFREYFIKIANITQVATTSFSKPKPLHP